MGHDRAIYNKNLYFAWFLVLSSINRDYDQFFGDCLWWLSVAFAQFCPVKVCAFCARNGSWCRLTLRMVQSISFNDFSWFSNNSSVIIPWSIFLWPVSLPIVFFLLNCCCTSCECFLSLICWSIAQSEVPKTDSPFYDGFSNIQTLNHCSNFYWQQFVKRLKTFSNFTSHYTSTANNFFCMYPFQN